VCLISTDQPFLIQKLDDRVVEAWAQQRLKFEPKLWMKEYRDELRSALRELTAGENEGLYAVYCSPQRDLCDVENVLIYNVGSSYLRNAAHTELTFERRFTQMPAPSPSLAHYQRYEIVPVSQVAPAWARGRTFAKWHAVLPAMTPLPKVSVVWWALKQGEIETLVDAPQEGLFGIELELGGHPHLRLNVADFVKVVTDASIVALQSHAAGPEVPELAQRISREVGAEPAEVARALCDDSERAIDGNRIVWNRGSGVQWNPADDRCVAGRLHRAESSSIDWTITGELFEVTAQP
jgi:hypothetical protein